MAAATLFSSVSLLCLIIGFTSQHAYANPLLILANDINQIDSTPSTTITNTCEPPDEAAAARKEINQHEFYPFSPDAYGIQSFNTDHELPPSTGNPGDDDCRVGDISGTSQERTSSCTWSYKTDYNPRRIPQSIQVAVCDDCPACKDSNAELMITEMSSCQEVTYNMKVLMREEDCVDGMFKYVMTIEEHAVACSCQRAVDNNGSNTGSLRRN